MTLNKLFHGILTTAAFVVTVFSADTSFAQEKLKLSEPELFTRLDSSFMTPDALAFDSDGSIFLSVTNATTFGKFGAAIVKLSRDGKVMRVYTSLPVHPVSEKVHPMGMAIASDGYLYIADNQSFAGQKHTSRVLRTKLQNGEPGTFETVVSGLNVANGLRCHDGYVYITDAWTDNERKSAIYRFNIAELNKKPVVVSAKNRQSYLIHEMELEGDVPNGVGVDGMDFDAAGNLYVGNFSSGTLTKIKLSKKTSGHEITAIAKDKLLIGCDGIFFHRESNSLLIANFMENSILQYNLSDKSLNLLWQNGDASCDALLDSPCDLAVVGNKLIVVNFDTYTTNANKTIDSCNTISVFTLQQ